MKKRKIILLLVGLIIFFSVCHIYLLRYFYYNKYNIHAQRAIIRYLEREYNQEFKLISTDVRKIGPKFRWTCIFQDSDGRQFKVYYQKYGDSKFSGNSYEMDYFADMNASIDVQDTYARIRVEECLGDKFDLKRHRSKIFCYTGEDYVIFCSENNWKEIVEILTELYFIESDFNWEAHLTYSVKTLHPSDWFDYNYQEVTKELQDRGEEITYETVYDYFSQKIK